MEILTNHSLRSAWNLLEWRLGQPETTIYWIYQAGNKNASSTGFQWTQWRHTQKNAWQWSHAFFNNSQYRVIQTWAKKFKMISNENHNECYHPVQIYIMVLNSNLQTLVYNINGDYGSCKGPFPPLQFQVCKNNPWQHVFLAAFHHRPSTWYLKMYRALGWSWILETESQSSKFHAIRFIHIVDGFAYSFRWFLWIYKCKCGYPWIHIYMHFLKILVSGTNMAQHPMWPNEGSLHHGSPEAMIEPPSSVTIPSFPLRNDEIRWNHVELHGSLQLFSQNLS